MDIAFEQLGHGKPLVLLHAFPFSRNFWKLQKKFFVEKNFQLIIPDLPGFGDSHNFSKINSMEEIAVSVSDLINKLGIQKASFCGISMGGYVALNLFRIFPDKFSSLILCDTTSTADTEEIRKNRYKLIEEIKQKGTTAISDAILKKLLSDHTLKNKRSLVEEIHNWILQANKEGTISALRGMAVRMDQTFILNKINFPTLLIFGEQDKITNLQIAKDLHKRIPNSELEIIKKCGHLSNLEKPLKFNQKLANFLKNKVI